jgi:hypothetical protein
LHLGYKSKSATLGASLGATGAPPGAGPAVALGAGGKTHKQKVDKLIKQNIRKNQYKIEETMMRQQLE